MSKKLTSPYYLISAIIVFVSFGFLFRALSRMDFVKLQSVISISTAVRILPLLLLNVIVLILVGINWRLVLEFVGSQKVSIREILPVFFRANIAKYIPGSVFEFATRNFLGKKLGWRHSDILLSSFIEIILSMFVFGSMLIVCLIFAKNSIPLNVLNLINQDRLLHVGILGGFCFAGLLGAVCLSIKFRERLKGLMTWRFFSLIAKFQTVSFFIFGINAIVFTILLHLFLNNSNSFSDFPYLTLIFFLSSLAGYAVPVAPAGIGVRESFLILLLSPSHGVTAATAAALTYRVIAVAADAIGYFLGLSLEKSLKYNRT